MTGQTASFARDTLHQAPITGKSIGIVGNYGKSFFVERGCHVGLSDGETHSIREALTEWAGGDFDAVGVAVLGMAWSFGIYLAEGLKVINCELVAQEMEEDVLQGATNPMRDWPDCVHDRDYELK
jgi:hypothetical protein